MKTLLTLALGSAALLLSISSDRVNIPAAAASPEIIACGCADINDLTARMNAVNAVIDLLSPQVIGPGSDDPLTELNSQKLDKSIKATLNGSGAGNLGSALATINPAACSISPSASLSACMGDAMTKHFENQIDACPSWKAGGSGSNNFRFGYTFGDAVSEELTSYSNELSFLESQIEQLKAQKCAPPSVKNSPPQPQQNPLKNPPAAPQSQQIVTPAIAINLAPRTGVVQYIFQGEAGSYVWINANSPIPFKIDADGRITGQGTIVHKVTTKKNCTVRKYEGVANVVVSGQLDGDVMDITFAARGGNQGDLGELVMVCEVAGKQLLERNIPFNPRSFAGTQKLRLPAPGEKYTITAVGMNPTVSNALANVKNSGLDPYGMLDVVGPQYKITLVTYYKR